MKELKRWISMGSFVLAVIGSSARAEDSLPFTINACTRLLARADLVSGRAALKLVLLRALEGSLGERVFGASMNREIFGSLTADAFKAARDGDLYYSTGRIYFNSEEQLKIVIKEPTSADYREEWRSSYRGDAYGWIVGGYNTPRAGYHFRNYPKLLEAMVRARRIEGLAEKLWLNVLKDGAPEAKMFQTIEASPRLREAMVSIIYDRILHGKGWIPSSWLPSAHGNGLYKLRSGSFIIMNTKELKTSFEAQYLKEWDPTKIALEGPSAAKTTDPSAFAPPPMIDPGALETPEGIAFFDRDDRKNIQILESRLVAAVDGFRQSGNWKDFYAASSAWMRADPILPPYIQPKVDFFIAVLDLEKLVEAYDIEIRQLSLAFAATELNLTKKVEALRNRVPVAAADSPTGKVNEILDSERVRALGRLERYQEELRSIRTQTDDLGKRIDEGRSAIYGLRQRIMSTGISADLTPEVRDHLEKIDAIFGTDFVKNIKSKLTKRRWFDFF